MPPSSIIALDEIRDPRCVNGRWHPEAIEDVVWRLHNAIRYRCGDGLPVDPSAALGLLGFSVEPRHTLGYFLGTGGEREVAAILDGQDCAVEYSRAFSPPVQRFTLAHEIGHIALHPPMVQHRDRPIHGGSRRSQRDPREAEADKFAALFLMPGEWVRGSFQRRFSTCQFELNDTTAFWLCGANVGDILREWGSKRGGARKLATSIQFNGKLFSALHERFGVSPEAMAIRLEELGLIQELPSVSTRW